MSLQLRDYQLDLIDRARDRMKAGVKRILITSPTGSGKTCLVAHMLKTAAQRGYRAWFCVHRKELLEQSVQTFIEAANIRTGIISAGYPATPQAPVQVCSVPSLKNRAKRNQQPDLIVWDECHHTASKSWSEIAQQFPSAVQIGLTATPQRLDGQGLAPYFDEILCGPSTGDLIDRGFLSPYTLYAPPNALDFRKTHIKAGDYNKHEVDEQMKASTVVGDAVSHYQQHCPDARALVFMWSLDASRQLAQQFEALGIPAAHVDGESERHFRANAMKRFRDGSLRVLCNVDLFGEGLDVPAVDAVFLLRPTQSLGLYLQQVGRGLRPSPGKAAVKIFDHVNNWEKHGLPDDPRDWTLNGREKRPRDSSAMGRRCEQCFGVSPIASKICRYCGVVFPVATREIEHVDGKLDAVNVAQLRAQQREFYGECQSLGDWMALAKRLGYKPGWAWRMMHLRHKQQADVERATAHVKRIMSEEDYERICAVAKDLHSRL